MNNNRRNAVLRWTGKENQYTYSQLRVLFFKLIFISPVHGLELVPGERHSVLRPRSYCSPAVGLWVSLGIYRHGRRYSADGFVLPGTLLSPDL